MPNLDEYLGEVLLQGLLLSRKNGTMDL